MAFATCLILLGVGIGVTGCESDRTGPMRKVKIELSPVHVTLRRGESADFVASGWNEYRWSLRFEDVGSLTYRTGNRTRYTNVSGSNLIQVLRVHAVVSGTNVSHISGQATIVHP